MTASPDRSRLLTVAAAAERLGMTEFTIRNWLALRKLEYVKIGRSTRIKESVVDALVAKGTRAALVPEEL